MDLVSRSSEHRPFGSQGAPFVPQGKQECLCHLGVIRFVEQLENKVKGAGETPAVRKTADLRRV